MYQSQEEPSVHSSNGSQRFQGGIHRWKGTCLKIEFSKMLLPLSSGLAICIKLQDGPLGTMSVDTSHL